MSPRHAAHHVFERTPGDATRLLPAGYRPRRPEATDLYRIVATHLETMLADARDRSPHGFGLPRHVEQTFRRFLDCGRLERGFARVACPTCHGEMLVPWSCKTRGLCSSCDARRMTETAFHLVDRVLGPEPGYRQSALLERVFGSQVTQCQRCGDRVRVVAFVTDPDVTARILEHLGIAPPPLSIAPARASTASFDDFA